MKFDLLTIDNLGKLGRGRSRNRPRDDQSLYGGIYPFVQTGDIKNAPFYITSYSQTYNEKGLSQSKLWKRGTLCITIAANIADTAILAIDACFPDSILGFTSYKEKSNTKFVKYCFDVYKTTLEAISKGTTQDNLSLDKLRKVKFRIPPLPVQHKIAAVLSAYDDLIENNNRRIAILEKMAEELYREWFVRMRFPGHEKVKIVKSIPEGWKIKRIDEVSQNYDGKRTPLSGLDREKMKGCIPYYGAAKIIDYVDKYIFDGKYLLIAEDGSVITSEGYPVLQLVNEKFWVNNHTHVLAGINEIYSTEWLYLSLIKYPIIGQITGAAQPKITQANLNKINLLTPTEEILIQFNKKILSAFELINNILKQNTHITISRDRLLSRLMSGKIDVEHLDIQSPPSMKEEEASA